MRQPILASAIALLMTTPSFAQSPAPTATVAEPVAGCDPMEIGPVYDASIDANATLACFQLVTPDVPTLTKLDLNLAGFRQGAMHDVSLVRVDPDGSTHAVSSDASGDPYRVVQVLTGPSVRWLALVGRTAGGSASSFQMQATVAERSDRYEPNDAITKATRIGGNQVFDGNLDNDADIDNYLIYFRADQKEAVIELHAPNGVVADIVDGGNRTGVLRAGKEMRVDTSQPVFMAIRGESAASASKYTVRVRDPKAIAVLSSYSSKENISHLAPGLNSDNPGAANVARSMDIEVTAFEGDHATPLGAGHPVRVYAIDSDGNRSWPVGSIDVVTDENGKARATLPISDCKGGQIGPIRIVPRVEHPSVWYITYNPSAVVHAGVIGSDPDALVQPLRDHPQWFQHICKETVEPLRRAS